MDILLASVGDPIAIAMVGLGLKNVLQFCSQIKPSTAVTNNKNNTLTTSAAETRS